VVWMSTSSGTLSPALSSSAALTVSFLASLGGSFRSSLAGGRCDAHSRSAPSIAATHARAAVA
jgi:hypothetical protein